MSINMANNTITTIMPYGMGSGYKCMVCQQWFYAGSAHFCPGAQPTQQATTQQMTPPGLISEERLRAILESVIFHSYGTKAFQDAVRQALAQDRDAQQRDYNNRKLARQRDEEEECFQLKSESTANR